MPSWSKLTLLVSLAAALSPLAEGHRSSTTKIRIGAHGAHAAQPRAPSDSKQVIVEMFQWNWDSVAAECTNFLGPAGYGYVQGTHHTSITPATSQFAAPLRRPVAWESATSRPPMGVSFRLRHAVVLTLPGQSAN